MIGIHNTKGFDGRYLTVRFSRIDGKVKILSVSYYGKDVLGDYGPEFFSRVTDEIIAAKY